MHNLFQTKVPSRYSSAVNLKTRSKEPAHQRTIVSLGTCIQSSDCPSQDWHDHPRHESTYVHGCHAITCALHNKAHRRGCNDPSERGKGPTEPKHLASAAGRYVCHICHKACLSCRGNCQASDCKQHKWRRCAADHPLESVLPDVPKEVVPRATVKHTTAAEREMLAFDSTRSAPAYHQSSFHLQLRLTGCTVTPSCMECSCKGSRSG